MKREKEEINDCEQALSVEERLMLLLTGVLCFPVGFALYFYFKEQKSKKYHMYFAKTGAWTGVVLVMLILISLLMFTLANYIQF